MRRNITEEEFVNIDTLQKKADYEQSLFKLKTIELKLRHEKVDIADGDLNEDERKEATLLKLTYEHTLNLLVNVLAKLKIECEVPHYARIDYNGNWIDGDGNKLV